MTARTRFGGFLVALLVGLLTLGSAALPAGAQSDDDAPAPSTEVSDAARELAERHAPIVMLKAQDDECDKAGEPYGPASVEIVLDNPEVLLRQLGSGDPVMLQGPTARDLFGYGRGFQLDFPGDALDPGCLYERDFRRFTEDYPPTVYAHVVGQEDHPGLLAVQYWIYWYYNDWNNKHESDWEGIQVLFEASSAVEALGKDPVSVGYAQHEGGEVADWDSSKLEREGSRPVVYPSAGSHASYYGSGLYLGRSASEGFGCDNTTGPSDRIDPVVVVLPDSVDDPDDPLAWLNYDGRWGERQNGPFNGPTGPASKGRWLEPIDWQDELRTSSVVIPAGGSQATAVIESFCGVVEWGSSKLIQFTTSPLQLMISLLLVVLLARWFVRRTSWSDVPETPLVRRRRGGEIIRSTLSIYRRDAAALLAFGLVFVPVAFIVGLLAQLVSVLPLVGDMLGLAGETSGTSLLLAAVAGGLPTVAGVVVLNALVSVYLDDRSGEDRLSIQVAARQVLGRWRSLGSGLLRAFVIVYLLLVSIVGIPWGIRQLIRYQFLSQAVMLDDHSGRGGLDRSSELVKGRWWHTGLMIGVFNTVAGAAALGVALLLLVVFSGLPLWLFSSLVALVYVAVMPAVSVAQVLLYGDAVAEHGESAIDESEPAPVG